MSHNKDAPPARNRASPQLRQRQPLTIAGPRCLLIVLPLAFVVRDSLAFIPSLGTPGEGRVGVESAWSKGIRRNGHATPFMTLRKRDALMRQTLVAILICLTCCQAVLAQDQSSAGQVSAAAADAMESLRQEVLTASVAPNLTVRDLIDRVGGQDELAKTLREAQRVGGARWLDDQTVQVQLVIDGRRIAATLVKIVRANPKNSPLPVDRVVRDLKTWERRTFSATGTSTSASNLERLRPPPSQRAWQSVSDDDRRHALLAARDNLLSRVLDSLRPIELGSGKNLGEVLTVPEVNQAMTQWLSTRPVTSVEFMDDLSVRLALYAPPEELWQTLKAAMVHEKQAPMDLEQAGWDRLQDQVTARVAPAIGTSAVAPGKSAPAQVVALPSEAPPWANQHAEAEAASPAHASKLRTARAAEALAVAKLRQRIESLPLDEKITLGEAARRDPRIGEAIARALGRARPFKVDYGQQGVVTVHVALNLSDLWAELTGSP